MPWNLVMLEIVRTLRFLAVSAVSSLLLAGCHAPSLPTPAHEQAKAQEHAELDTERQQMALIPPPSKSRFMTMRSIETWENPSITVQENLLEVRVLLADANPSNVGVGGMFRPANARKQVLTVSPDKLAEALTAIPQSAWPYGRVIAVEEAHKVPPSAEPAVRRAMENTIGQLNDLGLVVYDPAEGSVR